ncbi:response regulator transcription factor [Micromonospora sp. HUAS LYJ1]|uniref:helix-turn-helix transcriptional regulator n=1 Tax=Micromonospora TaxID=1873 RepID=UPI002671C38C|nr:response regulator transcription factor [Micromonospora sp. HUAS LYJ1]WKU07233.1 response regulator transcription factor [Micromonospora sp. HUAS LYJ1]
MHGMLEVDHDTMTVAVLVDNEVFGRGIEAVLGSVPEVSTVHRCGSRADYETLSRFGGIDFLIVAPPEAHWLENEGRAVRGSTHVILLVDEATTTNVTQLASMPVDGFVSQQRLTADLLSDTLRRSRRGELPMPPALTRALLARADEPGPGTRTRTVNLTARETEALTLLVKGLSNKQIARRLSISSHGAKRLVASIMLKLDSPNRTTAAINAIRAGLVQCD